MTWLCLTEWRLLWDFPFCKNKMLLGWRQTLAEWTKNALTGDTIGSMTRLTQKDRSFIFKSKIIKCVTIMLQLVRSKVGFVVGRKCSVIFQINVAKIKLALKMSPSQSRSYLIFSPTGSPDPLFKLVPLHFSIALVSVPLWHVQQKEMGCWVQTRVSRIKKMNAYFKSNRVILMLSTSIREWDEVHKNTFKNKWALSIHACIYLWKFLLLSVILSEN